MTRAAAHYLVILAPRAVQRVRMLLTSTTPTLGKPSLDKLFASLKQHRHDANEFFSVITYACDSPAGAFDVRRAFCNMLWNKAVWVSAVTGWLYDRRSSPAGAGRGARAGRVSLESGSSGRAASQAGLSASGIARMAVAHPGAGLRRCRSGRSSAAPAAEGRAEEPHAPAQSRFITSGRPSKPWAALLMYRLQRPRRPKRRAQRSGRELRGAVDPERRRRMGGDTRAEHARDGAGAGGRTMRCYEQRAIECYVSLIAAIAALDCEASMLDGGAGRARRRARLPTDHQRSHAVPGAVFARPAGGERGGRLPCRSARRIACASASRCVSFIASTRIALASPSICASCWIGCSRGEATRRGQRCPRECC